jgi:hypothetical protein
LVVAALLDAREEPLSRRLADAPLEDEEISAEEEAAVQEARDELDAGADLIAHEQIKREFGMA